MAGKAVPEFAEGQAPHVLVCDDSAVNCLLAKSVLEKDGCHVEVVHGGEEALQLLQRYAFDLVLLDIEMPGISGIEVTRQLRATQSERIYLPIILLTAKTDAASKLEGLQAGATDFLTKPFDPHELVARIRNFVGSKRLHDRLMTTNKVLEQERAKVHQVQMGLLPKAMPKLQGLRFAATYRPCQMAGGDFYDVIPREDGRILLAMGDVSGHGIPSAMYMAVLRAVLHAKAAEMAPIGEIIAALNHILQHALDSFSFVTFYLAEYDPATYKLIQIGAGHPPAMIQDLETNMIEDLPLHGCLPLGIAPDLDLVITEATLAPGQRLILYTDGIVEQQGPDGSFFERSNFVETLRDAHGFQLDQVPEFLMERLYRFAGTRSTADDVTLLMMEIQPSA